MQGYEALRSGAAWMDLTGRGILLATGEDRARLLHAITTNHIQQLKPGDACYAFLLNAQGRILGDVHVLALEDRFLLDTEPELREKLLAHIDHYIIADDVTLEDATDRYAVIAVEGPQAPRPDQPLVTPFSVTGEPGYRIYLPRPEKDGAIAALNAAGVIEASPEAARVVRLEHFKPRYGDDIFETTLPQETQQLHAISFNKGCYLGQEIVERVRSRGMVHRLLMGLVIDAEEPPEPGTPVMAGPAEAGKITSAAYSPSLGKTVALAYLRREHAAPGATLECAGSPAEPRQPYAP